MNSEKSDSIPHPNFFVAGVQKAGTTFLCSQLARHPEIFVSTPKEPLFFNARNYAAEKVGSYLESFYSEVGDERWIGEGSTLYFQNERAPHRLHDAFGPDLRFIICLRHPVEKAVSLYMHNFRRGRMTGAEVLTELRDGPFAIPEFSFYADSIERFLELFGRARMHFVFYETLRKNPRRFVDSATSFLDVPPLKKVLSKRINSGSRMRWQYEKLISTEMLPLLGKNQVQPKISRREIESLHELFASDIKRTEHLLGCDLSAWKELPAFEE